MSHPCPVQPGYRPGPKSDIRRLYAPPIASSGSDLTFARIAGSMDDHADNDAEVQRP